MLAALCYPMPVVNQDAQAFHRNRDDSDNERQGEAKMILVRRGCRAVVAALALMLAPVVAQAAPPVYTAIVDAGSGGTRLFFYKVTPGPYPVSELLFNTSINDPPDTPYEEDDGIANYACFTGDDPAARAFYATANVGAEPALSCARPQ